MSIVYCQGIWFITGTHKQISINLVCFGKKGGLVHRFHVVPDPVFDLRLALVLCLCGRPAEAAFVIAVVCSSWSAVNLATSKRSVLTPFGDQSLTSVRSANRMVARLVGIFGLGCAVVFCRSVEQKNKDYI